MSSTRNFFRIGRLRQGLCCLLLGAAVGLEASTYKSITLDFAGTVATEQELNLLRSPSGLFPAVRSEEGLLITLAYSFSLPTEGPFYTFAAKMRGQFLDTSKVTLLLRFRSLEGWGEWQAPGSDPDLEASDSALVSKLLFLPVETREVQAMLIFARTMPEKPLARVRFLQLDFFNPGELPQPEAAPAGSQEDACTCPLPPLVSRSAWGCPDGDSASCASPLSTTPTHLVIHHSAGPNSSSNWAASVLAIWNFHVNTNGWCDIGYNWLVDPNGVLYRGRGGPANVLGAHFCGKNSGTMGVCLMGNYQSTAPSAAALGQIRKLLAWKACDAGLDPLGSSLHAPSGVSLPVVLGHRDGCATTCPGDQLYAALTSLRSQASATLDSCSLASSLPGEAQAPFRLHPNPAQGEAEICWQPGFYETEIAVYDVGGRLWLRQHLPAYAGQARLDLSPLHAGLYWLSLRQQGLTRSALLRVE
jgi:hypothetical protein